ncbi:MAG: lysylphosphatidylglycerol synthase transmembrane domain-containing protein, partial [Candidatus Cloacimonetes bacterium]|nr:lysylphosphatidylglycerol synthase transmembrane domain-containing protein [Candidatus Cloacimonadota bacterium]
MKTRNLITLVSGLIIGILLLFIWLHFYPLEDIKEHFSNLNYYWVALASLAYLSAYFLRSWRWNLLLPLDKKPGLGKTWLYSMGGNLINYLIPLRVGDVVRAWFIKRNHNVPVINALPSVFIDKAFDTLAILFIIILIPFLAIEISLPIMVLLGLLCLVFIFTLGVLLFAAWHKAVAVKALQAIVSWLPNRAKVKVNRAINTFITELNLFEHHLMVLVFAVLLTAAGLLLDGIYFFLLFKAFGIPYPFALAMFGYTLINLSYALPQP